VTAFEHVGSKKKQIPHPQKTPFAEFAQGKRVRDDSFVEHL